MVQHQLYATMPKYVLRLAGEGASPSWYANVNPLVVVLTVNLVTQLMRKKTALTSMTFGMFIMPISALCMASGNMLDGNTTILGMHPVAFMMVVGIVFQGLAETLNISHCRPPKAKKDYTSVSATFTPSCHLYSDSAYQVFC